MAGKPGYNIKPDIGGRQYGWEEGDQSSLGGGVERWLFFCLSFILRGAGGDGVDHNLFPIMSNPIF